MNDDLDFDCVEERGGIWHVARYRGRTDDFTPIRCSTTDDDGIVYPGPIYRRAPTCPDCIRVVAPLAAVTAEEDA